MNRFVYDGKRRLYFLLGLALLLVAGYFLYFRDLNALQEALDAYQQGDFPRAMALYNELAAQQNPTARLLYISGAQADPASMLMPMRIKGETEAALRALPITTVMLRPGGTLQDAIDHLNAGLFHHMTTQVSDAIGTKQWDRRRFDRRRQ